MVLKFGTCGCAEQTPHDAWKKFDFIIADNHFSRSGNATATALNKPMWSPLFYGHRAFNLLDRPDQESKTYQELVYKKLSKPFKTRTTTVIIANEFITYNYKYYPNFYPSDILNYIKWAHDINPTFNVMIAEFKPWDDKRWAKMLDLSKILQDKSYKFSGVGIQLHLKVFKNAEIVLTKLPYLVEKFNRENIPVHFSEISIWQPKGIHIDMRTHYYLKILNIAIKMEVKSFSPWWIYPDYNLEKPMPTFSSYEKGYFHDINLATFNHLLSCHKN